MSKLNDYLIKRVKAKDSFTLSHRKIYILPTKEGIYFSFVLLLMLVSAINFSNNLIYFFTFLLASIAIIAMVYTQINLLGTHLRCGKAAPVFCGEKIYLPLMVTAKNGRSGNNIAIKVQIKEEIQVIDIFSDSNFEEQNTESDRLVFPLESSKRGLFMVPMIRVSSTYPLGLFNAWSNVKLKSTSFIYPQPKEVSAQDNSASVNGQAMTGHHPGQDEFYDLKRYIPGVSLKKVHWKRVAKGQGMQLKEFVEGSNQQKYWLDIEQFSKDIDIEERLSFLCFLVLQAASQGHNYGLKLQGEQVPINRGKQHERQCLKLLALYQEGRLDSDELIQ